MNFCENCGERLSLGIKFCENCGSKISISSSFEDKKNIINSSIKGTKVDGIVYTNLTLLASQLQKSTETIRNIIERFISDTSSYGINYMFVDVSSNFSEKGSIEEHLSILTEKVREFYPKYLFILGSSSVIPSVRWRNYASTAEYDPDISSDLPYATLDLTSPFDGQSYDYDEILCVGRLPNVSFENYFSNLEISRRGKNSLSTFGLSAKVWEDMSVHIYKTITRGPKLITSPQCTIKSVTKKFSSDTNMLLFNLHGSNQTEYWYGQEDDSYPEAVAPSSFEELDYPYFLAVEACYGAAYEGRAISKSILLSSLSGKCISFLGSSRIAFGASTPSIYYPNGCCADIICGEFLRNLKAGLSAGNSLNMARKKLLQASCDAEDIKTLAEFALYGDPSASIMKQNNKSFCQRSLRKASSKGFHIPQPDISRAVRMELISVEQRILDSVERMINSQYTDFKGLKPQFYKNLNRKDIIKVVFNKRGAVGTQFLVMQVTTMGQVKGVIESK